MWTTQTVPQGKDMAIAGELCVSLCLLPSWQRYAGALLWSRRRPLLQTARAPVERARLAAP
jgi:hypothetical protein